MNEPSALAAALSGSACLAAGLLVPRLIARIPEPAPEVVAVESDAAVPVGDEPSAGEGPAAGDGPKEAYADLAARPGLGRRCAVVSGIAGAAIGLSVGAGWPLLFLLPLVPIGVALAVVDWRTKLLPTAVIAPTYLMTIALVALCTAVTGDTAGLIRAGWGWLVAGGLFLVLWFIHPRGLGYGDVRLSGVLGIALGYLGWGPLLVGVYGAFLLGGLGGGLLSLAGIVERRAFPFGPFMLVGALVGVVAGDAILGGLVGG